MGKRIKYLIITFIVMVMGLLSRKFMFIFPKTIAPFVGDMLWATMIYFGFRFVFLRLKLKENLILSIIFCFGIEISQLYQTNWLNDIRNTTLGGLVLGHGFLWMDLISYSIGIVIALLIDKLLNKYI